MHHVERGHNRFRTCTTRHCALTTMYSLDRSRNRETIIPKNTMTAYRIIYFVVMVLLEILLRYLKWKVYDHIHRRMIR